jgi:hypothetical protein
MCRGAMQRAATLIFIADWSNCLRRKLLKVGSAGRFFQARPISPLRCGPLQVSALLKRFSEGLRARRENSEKMVNANCGTHVGCARVLELLPKSSRFLALRSAATACRRKIASRLCRPRGVKACLSTWSRLQPVALKSNCLP